jgi:hypothetical protein
LEDAGSGSIGLSSVETFMASTDISVSEGVYSTFLSDRIYYFTETKDIHLNNLTTFAETIKIPCSINSSQVISYVLQDCAGNVNPYSWITFDEPTSQIIGTTTDVSVQTTYLV